MTMISHLIIGKPYFREQPLAALRKYFAGYDLFFEHAFETVVMVVLAALFALTAYRAGEVFYFFQHIPPIALQGP